LLLLAAVAPELGRWLSLGLALLTVAMLQLWRGADAELEPLIADVRRRLEQTGPAIR